MLMYLAANLCVIHGEWGVAGGSELSCLVVGNGQGERFATVPFAGVFAVAVEQDEFDAFIEKIG